MFCRCINITRLRHLGHLAWKLYKRGGLVRCYYAFIIEFADEYPLDEERYNALRHNLSKCVSIMDSLDTWFMNALHASKCVTDWQKQALLADKVMASRNELLIFILMRKSVAGFKKFLKCLDESSQSHVMLLFAARGGTNSLLYALVIVFCSPAEQSMYRSTA
jgi:hypothetical protein